MYLFVKYSNEFKGSVTNDDSFLEEFGGGRGEAREGLERSNPSDLRPKSCLPLPSHLPYKNNF